MESSGPGDDTSKVIRLPRRPRRVTTEASARPRDAWSPEAGSAFDPAPTKPVLRSDLQRETGWWPAVPIATQHDVPDDHQDSAAHEANVIDLDATRRRRTDG